VISFAQLKSTVDRMAAALRRQIPDDPGAIALLSRDGVQRIETMLAILRSGAACFALATEEPVARMATILRNARVRYLVAAEDVVVPAGLPVAVLGCSADEAVSPTRDLPCISGRDVAYIICTSGSTGTPKAVAMPHDSLAALVEWQMTRSGLVSAARTLQFAPVGFDVFYQEVFSTLGAGGTLVLGADQHRRRPRALLELIERERIARIFVAPSVLRLLAEVVAEGAGLGDSLREVVCAGEQLNITPEIRQLFARLPQCALENQYGPAETHVATAFRLQGPPSEWPASPPIGTAVADREVFVLDEAGGRAKEGAIGEIAIGGVGPAHGYVGRDDLTAKRFVEFARPGGTSTRIYLTGDLGYAVDGVLHFVGRRDDQVKLGGFRVELGEVDAALRGAPGVRAASSKVWSENGAATLVGYLVMTDDADGCLTPVRKYVEECLPGYMRPRLIELLGELPLTSSGKVDRRALPRPVAMCSGASLETSPQGAVERTVLQEMRELLKSAALGTQHNFIAAGADSITVIRLLDRLAWHFGVALDLAEFASVPTAAGLARMIERAASARASAPQRIGALRDRTPRVFSMTPLQQAYFVGSDAALELGGVPARVYAELECADLNIERLRAAVGTLIARHEMLRTTMIRGGKQAVLDTVGEVPIVLEDVRTLPESARLDRLMRLRESLSRKVRPVGAWPLFDVAVLRWRAGLVRVCVSIDLLIGDLRSIQILARELVEGYTDPHAVPEPLAFGFGDYLLHRASTDVAPARERAREYWMARMLAPPPALPRPELVSRALAPRFARLSGRLARDAWERIKHRAARSGVTPTAVALTAFCEVLARWSESRSFTVNLPTMRRAPVHPDVDRIVGEFTTVTLLSVQIAAEETFAERVREIQRRLWCDLAHADFCGVEVLRELRRRGKPHEFVPVVFTSLLGMELQEPEATILGWGAASRYGIVQTPQTVLDHHLGEIAGELRFNWDAVSAAFAPGVLDALFEAYCDRLAALGVEDLEWASLSDPVAYEEAGSGSGQVAAEIVRSGIGPTLETGLWEHADRDGLAPAVLATEGCLNYQGLARAAEELISRLGAAGLESGDRVAIIMRRGWRQVAAAVAVARAGGIYVPIDPSWPPARQRKLLLHSDATVILTEEALLTEVAAVTTAATIVVRELCCVSADRRLVHARPETDDLAYIIYTSGSTGEPKGVAVTHGAAMNSIVEVMRTLRMSSRDRVLAVSSLSFDLSVFDIFGSLNSGGAVIIPTSGELRDPRALLALMQAHEVTIWNSVPIILEILTAYLEKHGLVLPKSLRAVMLSGDWIPRDLPGRLRRLTDASLFSLGGATEAGIWSVIHRIEDDSPGWPTIPYGRPLANQTAYVLDESLRPRPEWVPGSLYIGGSSLAREYWGDPERTRTSFIQHPVTGERLYRTGDLARCRPGGVLELLGREDRQVKLLGHRVELGEVEAASLQVEGVRAAVAVPVEEGALKRLVLFVQMDSRLPAARSGEVRRALEKHLRATLTAAMVPSMIHVVEEWPLNSNAKVDRSRLVQMSRPTRETHGGAVTSDMHQLLTGMIGSLLKTNSVPLRSSFGELGLNSLDLVTLRAQLEQALEVSLPVTCVFANPTVESLGDFLREKLWRDGAASRAAAPQLQSGEAG